MLMIGARYSSLQSDSVAATISAPATPAQRRARGGVDAHLDALVREHRADHRQEARGDGGVHEQRLGGVARAHLLRLGVVDDRERHRQVGGGVDVDVAVAVEVLEHRHLRLARDALDQALAAARDDEVDRLRRGDQMADRGAVGGRTSCTASGGRPASASAACTSAAEREVRAQRLRAAAQDAGVAALDRERRRLDRHVRPALVDHREDADRHAHAADPDAARLLAQLDDGADRIGHRRDLLAAEGDRFQGAAVEPEPIDHRRRQAVDARRREIAGVGLDQRSAPSRRRRASARSAALRAATGAAASARLAAAPSVPMWATVACRSAEVMADIVSDSAGAGRDRFGMPAPAMRGARQMPDGKVSGGSRSRRARHVVRRFPPVERHQRARLVEMDDGVELARQARLEVVALALGLGPGRRRRSRAAGAARRAPARAPRCRAGRAGSAPGRLVEERLEAAVEAGPHLARPRRLVPVARCCDGAVVCAEPSSTARRRGRSRTSWPSLSSPPSPISVARASPGASCGPQTAIPGRPAASTRRDAGRRARRASRPCGGRASSTRRRAS